MITMISSDDYVVTDSGSVFLFSDKSNLEISQNVDDFVFKIVFLFETVDNKKQFVDKNVVGNTIEIKCVNFNNELGTGTIEPVNIATINHKKLYIHFWTYLQGSQVGKRKARKLEYTFYLER